MWGPRELGLDTTHKDRSKYSPDIGEGTSIVMKETCIYIDADRIIDLLEARIGLYLSMYSIFFVKWRG